MDQNDTNIDVERHNSIVDEPEESSGSCDYGEANIDNDQEYYEAEDHWNHPSPESEDEGTDGYKEGGYHFVQLGDTFKNGRYVVQTKLGWGQYSTVWLAWDTHHYKYVALKIQKSSAGYTDAAMDEIAFLERIREGDIENNKCVVHLLDHFKHTGPNGRHVCLVFELLGDNLLTLIQYYEDNLGLPICRVKQLCYYILVGLDYLHRELEIIHTDLKPENIVLKDWLDRDTDPTREPPFIPKSGSLTKNQKKKLRKKGKKVKQEVVEDGDESFNGDKNVINGKVKKPSHLSWLKGISSQARKSILSQFDLQCKVSDMGTACWADKKITDDIQTRQYRAPEVFIGADYTTSVDMWSFACLAFELATGDFLFEAYAGNNFTKEEDHIAMMIELLGPFPKKIALSGEYSHDFFNNKGQLKRIKKLKFWTLKDVLVTKYEFSEKNAREFADFLLPLLNYDPARRPTAAQCLVHQWLQGYPLDVEQLQEIERVEEEEANEARAKAWLAEQEANEKYEDTSESYEELLERFDNVEIED